MTSKNQNIILLGLRLAIVFVYLWHGLPKALDFEMAMGKFESMGFPGFLGPIIGWLEIVGAALILVGFQNKWANLLLVSIIIVAILGVQLPKGVTAGLERDLLLFIGGLVSAFFGPGLFAIDNGTLMSEQAPKTVTT